MGLYCALRDSVSVVGGVGGVDSLRLLFCSAPLPALTPSMANEEGNRVSSAGGFSENEKVFGYHMGVPYKAKVCRPLRLSASALFIRPDSQDRDAKGHGSKPPWRRKTVLFRTLRRVEGQVALS